MKLLHLNELRNVCKELTACGDYSLSNKLKIIIAAENNLDNVGADLTYSSVMRDLRHNYKDKVKLFMETFKQSFDEAILDELEDPDRIALFAAIKEIGYESA